MNGWDQIKNKEAKVDKKEEEKKRKYHSEQRSLQQHRNQIDQIEIGDPGYNQMQD